MPGSIGRPEPYPPGVNEHRDVDSVTLLRQRCTGRAQFTNERCEAYAVTVRADGRVLWDGHAFVEVEGPAEAVISPSDATRLIERTHRRMQALRLRQCAVDHTHYVQVDLGRAQGEGTEVVRGCGPRFQRVARPIDRVAETGRWR